MTQTNLPATSGRVAAPFDLPDNTEPSATLASYTDSSSAARVADPSGELYPATRPSYDGTSNSGGASDGYGYVGAFGLF